MAGIDSRATCKCYGLINLNRQSPSAMAGMGDVENWEVGFAQEELND